MGHKAKIGDLLPLDTKSLQWDPENPAAFVGALADAVGGEAEKAITWYLEKKDGQRLLSRTFRVAAIVLVMAAALLPILGEIFKTEGRSSIWLSPGWASVALVLAATLLVLDRFYGCSSSWMRFMATEMQIREALHAFRMDFHILRTDWPGGKPSEKQVREGLERCRGFLAQLDGLLRAELDAWVQEFRTSLKDIDEMVKLRGEAAKAAVNTAGINVVVENGEQVRRRLDSFRRWRYRTGMPGPDRGRDRLTAWNTLDQNRGPHRR